MGKAEKWLNWIVTAATALLAVITSIGGHVS